MNAELSLQGLSYSLPEHALFHDLNCTLAAGQALWVQGANGAGKTTLLRLLSTLNPPSAGVVCWNGVSIFENRASYLKQMHYFGHQPGVKAQLSVTENIQYWARLFEVPVALPKLLVKIELSEHQDQLAGTLSAGQKRRLGFTRLLLETRPLWILDEPLTNIDAQGQRWFYTLLQQHLAAGGLAVLASHQALELAQARILTLGTSHV